MLGSGGGSPNRIGILIIWGIFTVVIGSLCQVLVGFPAYYFSGNGGTSIVGMALIGALIAGVMVIPFLMIRSEAESQEQPEAPGES